MEMRQTTKIILAYELLKEGFSKSHIAKHLGVSRRTIIRWSQAIEEHTDSVRPRMPSSDPVRSLLGIRDWVATGGQF